MKVRTPVLATGAAALIGCGGQEPQEPAGQPGAQEQADRDQRGAEQPAETERRRREKAGRTARVTEVIDGDTIERVVPQQTTQVKPADDWVRDEIHAVLRGEEVKGYAYDAIHDLDDAIGIFTLRQRAYAASSSSGVRRLKDLARTQQDEGHAQAPVRAATAGKRLFDIMFSAVALIILAPLLAAVAIAIKLTSSGGVLLLTDHVGRDGRTFTLMKFRYFRSDAAYDEAEGVRYTSVGRILCRLSLQDLPQLLNVLRGDMSLVGPPPLLVQIARLIPDFERHPSTTLRPGMTGLGRLSGNANFVHQMALEDDYATARWSMVRDLGIVVRSLIRLLRPSY